MANKTKAELEADCAVRFPEKYSTSPQAAEGLQAPPMMPARVLTGEVASCDFGSQSIKLKLTQGITAQNYALQKSRVTLGDQNMQCSVNEADHTLDCIFPGTPLPAQIKVSAGNVVVNDFIFTGETCNIPPRAPNPAPTPILTGEVTYCDLSSHTLNLRLHGTVDLEEYNPKLTINRVEMTCTSNQAYPTILTCTYPGTVNYPAIIEVTRDGFFMDSISFDGSGCSTPVGPNIPKEGAPPACTDYHLCPP